MLIFSEDISYKTIILHCGSSTSYGAAIFLVLLLTDHKYNLGKFQCYPLIGLFLMLELGKYFIGFYVSPNEDPYARRDDRGILSLKKPFHKLKLKDILKCLLLFGAGVVVYFITFILFGAEVFSKHEETLMISMLLTALTLVHACINLGSQSVINIVLGMKPNTTHGKMIYRNILGTLFGAWLGAFFIPLDWDRPWQEWPITCALGCILGFTCSNFLTTCAIVYHHSKKEKYGSKFL